MLKPLADASRRSLSGTALVRIDVNAADDWRLEAVVPTIQYLAERAKKVIVISHKGRPNPGQRLGALSLWADAQKLQKHLKQDVWFITDTTVPAVRKELATIPDGTVVVLENIRAFKGEASDAASFAESLASLGDYYVSDAFPVLHHPAASVTGLPRLMTSYAGFQLMEELARLGKLEGRVRRPYVVLIGGAKASDKLGVLQEVIDKADKVLIGGACANALLALSGAKVGNSIYERDPKLLAALKPFVGHKKIVLPIDFARGGGKILDIGPKTARLFAREVAKAGTVLWTGPLGMIEQRRFAKGTLAVAQAIARNRKAFSVTGGGETVTFLRQHKLDRKFSFISTGGGAMIDFVAGKKLPGLLALAGKKLPVKQPAKKTAVRAPQAVVIKQPKLASTYDIFFHNDFDGYATAAVFYDFLAQHKKRIGRYVACEYGREFDGAWLKRDGLTRYAGQKKLNPAILVDFRYHPQAAFWYDNHQTAFESEEWKQNFQPDTAHLHDLSYASACHLAYDALVQHYGYVPRTHIRDLVRWADFIDAARFTNPYQTIALREPALRIDASISTLWRTITPAGQGRPESMPWLVELLATKPLETVARDKRIATVVEQLQSRSKEALSHYRKKLAVRGVVAFADMSDFDGRLLRFAPFYLAHDAVFAITVSTKSNGDLIAQVGVSPWKRERNAFNIGALMTQYNGGGHKDVGVMRFTSRRELDEAIDTIISLFNGSTS